MGGCQNYGPLLGPLNTRCRIILRTQKGTIILTTTHIFSHHHQQHALRKADIFEGPRTQAALQEAFVGLDLLFKLSIGRFWQRHCRQTGMLLAQLTVSCSCSCFLLPLQLLRLLMLLLLLRLLLILLLLMRLRTVMLLRDATCRHAKTSCAADML